MEQQNECEREIEECIQLFCHPNLLELTCSNNQTRDTVTPPPCTYCSLQPSGWMHNSGLFNFTLPGTRLPPIIKHPTHPNHPLALFPTSAYPTVRFTCDSCCLRIDGFCYYCNLCNFCLHVLCASLPPEINHPSHPGHPLSLLQTPAYPSGWFSCNGCRIPGHGRWYHCRHCNFDLHVLCAALPPLINHPSHPNHPLFFTPTSTYPNILFTCNRCRNRCHGFCYRCHHCNFDLHVRCASLPLSPSHQSQPQSLGNGNGGIQHLNQSNGHNGGIGNALASGVLSGIVNEVTQSIIGALISGNNN
ncbi:hypothetical protein SLA2020_112090 [Shorea laevis]